jgi:hypothetical protein
VKNHNIKLSNLNLKHSLLFTDKAILLFEVLSKFILL